MKASHEVDRLLGELACVAEDREQSVRELEDTHRQLKAREEQLKVRIEELERVPIPVAEHFANIVEATEKRNARRDYMLFAAGALVTTVLAVVLGIIL